MTGVQIVVNIVLAVVAFLLVRWALGYIPELPNLLSFLLSLIAAVVVFVTNTAARLGVR